MAQAVAAARTPLVLDDPRFQAGRELVKRGLSDEGGVEIFGTLLEELNVKYGGSDSGSGGSGRGGGNVTTEETTTSTGTDTGRNNDTTSSRNIECAPAYYEYGNALHYAALSRREREEQQQQQQQQDEEEEEENHDDDDDDEKKPAAVPTSSTGDQPKVDGDGDGGSDDDDDDDLQLALEMMESAFSILQLYEEDATTTSTADNSSGDDKTNYLSWVLDQLPRVLMGIGDVLSSLGRFPDATDVFTRALERRKEQLEQKKGLSTASTSTATSTDNASVKPDPSLDLLKSYRLVCEAAVATAQALLDCPPDEDVITTETKSLLVPKDERISYVEGYYWQARDALQEVLLTLAELEGKGQNQAQTTSQPGGVPATVVVDKAMKEDVSHIAILVMGLGEALAEAKEEDKQDQSPGPDGGEPLKKRSKR
mmetsp:Transcript_18174/g.43933  ORF Transcript_18174/g.43933 Transcript_18174/m.43933 type:complete len:425 (+) Transcript_18174:182-1456(+)